MRADTTPLLQGTFSKHALALGTLRFKPMMFGPRFLTARLTILICIALLISPVLFWHRDSLKELSIPDTLKNLSVPYARPPTRTIPQFTAYGDSKCFPDITPEFIENATIKHNVCRKYSPFRSGRGRIATVTAHFGEPNPHYQKAFKTHLVHSLVHGTEVHVMCDPIVDDLWNKPAFILQLLMQEMLKSEKDRLEWIQWVDRDTMILDQCRPISSFLPPEEEKEKSWWKKLHLNSEQADQEDDAAAEIEKEQANQNKIHLIANNDFNGLNNGIFLLRVDKWAIELFTAILAFRHYRPDVALPFTEQSAMEQVIQTERFRHQVQIVPQIWFNTYEQDHALYYKTRTDADVAELYDFSVRRGDYLVHFAGHPEKGKAIEEWGEVLEDMEDVWQAGTVQRDVSEGVARFWRDVQDDRLVL